MEPSVAAKENYDLSLKLVLFGDPFVGKSRVTCRCVDDYYDIRYVPTIGVDYRIKTIELSGKRIKLQIWDVSGDMDRFYSERYCYSAEGIILMYDITNHWSFNNITEWLQHIKLCAPQYVPEDVQLLLIGNKCDLEEWRKVPREKGLELAQSLGMPFLETSAKTGVNINEAFELLALQILWKMKNLNTQNGDGNTALHLACYGGWVNIIKLLLAAMCDTRLKNKKGKIPQTILVQGKGLIHWACHWENVPIMDHLVNHESYDVNHRDDQGNTALHLACRGGCISTIKLLLAAKCDTRLKNKKGEIPQTLLVQGKGLLHWACHWGDVTIIDHLVNHESYDVNHRDDQGRTPLHYAVLEDKSISTIKALLTSRYCDPNITDNAGDAPLHSAVMQGAEEVVDLLAKRKRCDLNICDHSGNTPLHLAITHSRPSISMTLIQQDNVSLTVQNAIGDTPLHLAINKWQIFTPVIVTLLAASKCDPNIRNYSGDAPLHSAVIQDGEKVVDILAKSKRCDLNIPDHNGNTPLHLAIIHARTSIATLLLQQDSIDPTVQNASGNAPLHLAIINGQASISTSLLQQHSVNPVVPNVDGNTPLHLAVLNGQASIATILLQLDNIDPTVQNVSGNTPLHLAIINGKMDSEPMLQLLIQKMKNLNTQNRDGNAALHLACYGGCMNIIKLLLAAKCDTRLRNNKDEVPQTILVKGKGLLHWACHWGDVTIIDYLVNHESYDVNHRDDQGRTPLHYAVLEDKSISMIKALLTSRGCDPNITDNAGDAPLHSAVMQGAEEVVDLLAKRNRCDLNICDHSGNTPLHLAITHSKPSISMTLIQQDNVSLTVQNAIGDTPLHMAINKWQIFTPVIVTLLAASKCDPNIRNYSGDAPLHSAVIQDGEKVVDILAKSKRCDLNIHDHNGNTPLHLAIIHARTSVATLLLQQDNIDPTVQNASGNAPLHLAILNGQASISTSLLQQHSVNPVVPNVDGNTPLHLAVLNGQASIATILLQLDNIDPTVQNVSGNTPLHLAIINGKMDSEPMLQLLIQKMKNLNTQNRDGNAALHLACYGGCMNIIKLLLATKCDTRLRNNKDEVPQTILVKGKGLLHWACHWGDVTIIDYLVNHESYDVNHRDDQGRTPLHSAVLEDKSISTIKALLTSRDCDPNIRDNAGDAPLHSAVKLGREEVAGLLVKSKRCDLNISDRNGNTPLHLAITHARTPIATLLLQQDNIDPTVQNASGDTPLHLAIINGKMDSEPMLQLLIQKMKNLNTQNRDGNAALHLACYGGCMNIIKLLLAAKCDTRLRNNKDEVPQTILVKGKGLIHWACHWEDVTIMDHLVNHESYDVNHRDDQGNTALHLACRGGCISTIKLLLAAKCDTRLKNKKGEIPQTLLVQGKGLIHWACHWEDVTIMDHLVNHESYDVNHRDDQGNTALHLACYGEQLSTIKLLLATKCDTRLRNNKDEVPQTILVKGKGLLHWACHWGDVTIIDYLVNHESYDVNHRDDQGRTPLHSAVLGISMIKALLPNRECDPNIRDNAGVAPLHSAVKLGTEEVAGLLVKSKRCNLNISDRNGNTPLHLAMTHARTPIATLLLQQDNTDPTVQNVSGNTPLHLAIINDKMDSEPMLQLLIQKMKNLNTQNRDGNAALHLACYGGCMNIIKLLLATKCDTRLRNNKDEVPQTILVKGKGLLHWACHWGDVTIIDYLVNHESYDVNHRDDQGRTPLHYAVLEDKSISTIKALLTSRYCDPNITDNAGDAPLHSVAMQGAEEVVDLLVKSERCDLNICDHSGNTPLHLAITHSRPSISMTLIQQDNVSLTVQNAIGDTPLHLAINKWQIFTPVIVSLLAASKCDPNIRNYSGNAPLHSAVMQGAEEVVDLLAKSKRCDLNICDHSGNTPLHLAITHSRPSISMTLIQQDNVSLTVQNAIGDTPLHLAISKWQIFTPVIVTLLAASKCDPNIRNYSGNAPLHSAVIQDGEKVVDILTKSKRCDLNIPDHNGNTPLHLAITHARTSIATFFLQQDNIDLTVQNANGNAPLHLAIINGQASISTSLLQQHSVNPVVPNVDGNIPLHLAVLNGKASIATILLQLDNIDPTVQNVSGNTPLHLAIVNGKMDSEPMLQLLIQKMKNLNTQNRDGNAALHLACYGGCMNIIKLLLAAKCDTRLRNYRGKIPQTILVQGEGLLHWACHWEDVTIIDYLVNHESYDVNHRDDQGRTPLHYAVLEDKSISTIKALLTSRGCDPNITDDAGDAPLHTAVMQGAEEVVDLLVKRKRCDLNIHDHNGNTPLHLAIIHARTSIATLLLQQDNIDPTVQNASGSTPLHLAIINDKMDSEPMLQLLIQKMKNLNTQNRDGNAALHLACYGGCMNIIKLLLAAKCDTRLRNNKDEVPQTILVEGKGLLHWSCHWEDVTIIDHLVNHESYDVNHRDDHYQGRTPLQEAILYAISLSVTEALLASRECDPNITDNAGDASLHTAVMLGREEVVDLLVKSKRCDLNVPDQNGNTPLHLAITYTRTSIATFLLQKDNIDPTIQNTSGDTPLHLATINGQVSIATSLLQEYSVNPAVPNADGNTPLHLAVTIVHVSMATLLLQQADVDPSARNTDGNTPLHLACKVKSEDDSSLLKIVKLLLSHPSVDPECINNLGQTPVELTKNYRLIQEIFYVTECKTKHAIQTYIKIFFVGNPGTGKSTLVKAVRQQAGRWWTLVPGFLRRVRGVPPHTAGIIPTTFRSKTFGNTVLYDLAGQLEYYSSHAAVIESTVLSSPPAFLVLVNLSEPIDEISSKAKYWSYFVASCVPCTSTPPCIILVGSHADMVGKKNANTKLSQIAAALDQSDSIHFAGYVALDCRDPVSRGLNTLCSQLEQSCSISRKAADVALHCHVLYAFLLTKLPSHVTCKVSEVVEQIEITDALLPKKLEKLVQLLSTLSDRGLILLVKNSSSIQDSWVILQEQILLSEVNGSVFAPDNFKQHRGFSMSTGVVPLSKIRKEFPQYSCEMIVGFLTHLEFCFKIDDPETKQFIECTNISISPDIECGATNLDSSDVSQTDPKEEFYFFPALVSIENPLHVWEESSEMTYQCCWLYTCAHSEQFLMTRLLHVLILRLAFFFALAADDADIPQDAVVLHRRCSVWKHGIGWLRDGTETVVEVGLQCQWVVVMIRCRNGAEVKCAQLRSAIIRMVCEVKLQFCKSVEMYEAFVNPPQIQYPFSVTENLIVYKITEVARALVQNENYVIDSTGRSQVEIKELLFFEPYFGLGGQLLDQLFDPSNADKDISHNVLNSIASHIRQQMELYEKAFTLHFAQFSELCAQAPNDPVRQCLYLLQLLKQNTERGTYQEFRERLDHFSVFCGRNPLEVADGRCSLMKLPRMQQQLASQLNAEKESPMTIVSEGSEATCTRPLLDVSQAVPLTPSNVIKVCDILKSSGFSSADWESLAPRLGVMDTKSIWTVHPRDPFLCLYDVICQWLQSDPQASWEKLAAAVSKVEGYGPNTEWTILGNAEKPPSSPRLPQAPSSPHLPQPPSSLHLPQPPSSPHLPQAPSSPPLLAVVTNYHSTESGILTVHEGELVEMIDNTSRNEWCLVRTTAREPLEGWVPMEYLQPYETRGYAHSATSHHVKFHHFSSPEDTKSSSDTSEAPPTSCSSLRSVVEEDDEKRAETLEKRKPW